MKPTNQGGLNMYRQGDVFLVVREIPANATRKNEKKIILAYGEVTGHCHVVEEVDNVELYESDGRFYLRVNEPAHLNHQEHSTIEIPIGNYEVVRQREYSPLEVRRVQD